MRTWIQHLVRLVAPRPPIRRAATQRRLTVERLDNRFLPSATSEFQQTNLVSDQPGIAQITGGKAVIVTGRGQGGNRQVGLFDGATLLSLGTIPGLDPNFRDGIFVG